MLSRESFFGGILCHAVPDFGGNNNVLAVLACRHPLPENALRFAANMTGYPARVDISCIDKVAAVLNEGVQNGKRGLLIARPAKYIAAQTQGRDIKIGNAELSILHV